MNERIDVLAVMARMANCQYDGTVSGRYSEEEARTARAAVAELIEAHKELRARYVSLFNLYKRPTYHESSSPGKDLNLALARTDAALARVGGAA